MLRLSRFLWATDNQKKEDMSDTELGGASPEVDVGTSSAFGIFYGSVVTVLLMTAVTSMMRMIG